MTPDPSQWRSSASYEHVDDLTASNLAWEWLRRNEAYDEDFAALMQTDADLELLTDKIRQQWRLRFPRGPSPTPACRTNLLASAGRYKCRRTHAGTHPPDGRR
nr:DUF6499 domain-containing protein [Sphingobium yanoikuyae]